MSKKTSKKNTISARSLIIKLASRKNGVTVDLFCTEAEKLGVQLKNSRSNFFAIVWDLGSRDGYTVNRWELADGRTAYTIPAAEAREHAKRVAA